MKTRVILPLALLSCLCPGLVLAQTTAPSATAGATVAPAASAGAPASPSQPPPVYEPKAPAAAGTTPEGAAPASPPTSPPSGNSASAGSAGPVPPSAPPPPPPPPPTAPPRRVVPGGGYEESSQPTTEWVEEETLNRFQVIAAWEPSFPMGSTSDFVSAVGLGGFSLDALYWATPRFGFGIALGWNDMIEKKASGTLSGTLVTVTGKVINEFISNPLLLKVRYSFFDRDPMIQEIRKERHAEQRRKLLGGVLPYVALGGGGSRLVQRVDAGVAAFEQESWHFALVPEVGIEVPTPWFSAFAAARLYYIAGSSSLGERMYGTLSLGAGFQ